jgi:C4-dicarboxylate transporter DctM subunit
VEFSSNVILGISSLGVLIVFVLAGIPIAISCALIGLIGLYLNSGLNVALTTAGVVPYSAVAKYTMIVLPLFMLMGHFASVGGYVRDFFQIARKWFGSIRGGIVMGTMATCAALGAVSGSTVASSALMAKVALPEMIYIGVNKRLAAGCVVMGGTLSALIPPSLGLVFYAVLTDVPIGKLLIAGILPGVLTALVWIILVFFLTLNWPNLVPQSPSYSFKEKLLSLKGTWPIIALAILVLGGMYTGLFTPTEAAAVGVVGTFALLFVKRETG